MRPTLAWLLLLVGSCAPGPGAETPTAPAPLPTPVVAGPDQVWRGSISCDPIPGITRKVLVQRLELRVTGGVATYHRTVLQADSEIETNIREHGEGVVGTGGPLTLKGEATGGQYSYTAEYSGLLAPDGAMARLMGYQHWRFSGRPPAERACQITLRRAV